VSDSEYQKVLVYQKESEYQKVVVYQKVVAVVVMVADLPHLLHVL
jgi:hypothetical protein